MYQGKHPTTLLGIKQIEQNQEQGQQKLQQ